MACNVTSGAIWEIIGNRSRGADGFVMGFMIETLYTFRAKTVLLGQYRGAAKSDLASQWDSRSYHSRERLLMRRGKNRTIAMFGRGCPPNGQLIIAILDCTVDSLGIVGAIPSWTGRAKFVRSLPRT